jgi:hypothetical protein
MVSDSPAELYLGKKNFPPPQYCRKSGANRRRKGLKIYSENALRLINTTESAYWDIKNHNKRNGIKNYLDRI